jgi:sulfide dehydrogenase cytochrome subunit
MMMRANKYLFLTAMLAVFSVASGTDMDAITKGCNDCHGDNGVSQWADVPTIAGMPEYVHSDALFAYRDNTRPCAESEYRQGDTSRPATTMCDAVADLDDATLEDIALNYFELPFVAAQQEFDADLAAAGQTVHDEKCDKCHSEGGSNPDDEAGILAGQWMDYLANSFAEYASGDREQPKKMKEKMDELSAADATALQHYYASQQ